MIQLNTPDSLKQLTPMFRNNPPNFVIDMVLEGIAGSAYVDQPSNPQVVMLAYADLVAIAGDPFHPAAEDLIQSIPFEKGILSASQEWDAQIKKVLGEQIVELERFAFTDQSLNREHLQTILAHRSADYLLRKIDATLAEKILTLPAPISEDHVHNYGSIEQFLTYGVGYCLLDEEEIVSIASSYGSCSKGIEIQINTIPAYRGQGLAAVVSAALMDDCLGRGLAPHWDAANSTSARLAERLGYTPLGKYEMLLRIPGEE